MGPPVTHLVDRAQRQMPHKSLERRPRICGQRKILRKPLQPVPQLHRPAGRIVSIRYSSEPETTGNIARRCGFPVNAARHCAIPRIRSAEHADTPVRPCLPRDPVQRVIAVAILMNRRLERPFAGVPAPHVLNNDGVAAVDEHPVPRDEIRPFAIGAGRAAGCRPRPAADIHSC